MGDSKKQSEFRATEVAKELDRFNEQNWDRHTVDAYETIEEFAQAVVRGGTFTPEPSVEATLSLTWWERLSGKRQQDMTAMLSIGMVLGAALERDVPADSVLEEVWKRGDIDLP